jgi:hypothetical protein
MSFTDGVDEDYDLDDYDDDWDDYEPSEPDGPDCYRCSDSGFDIEDLEAGVRRVCRDCYPTPGARRRFLVRYALNRLDPRWAIRSRLTCLRWWLHRRRCQWHDESPF